LTTGKFVGIAAIFIRLLKKRKPTEALISSILLAATAMLSGSDRIAEI
jgi:hypothetical protein